MDPAPPTISSGSPTNFTTPIPGTHTPPSYHTTKLTPAPDMLSGGTVDLTFTLHLTLADYNFTWGSSTWDPEITKNYTYALSGSIQCDGTELKLPDNLRMFRKLVASKAHFNSTSSISYADGSTLDPFSAWAAAFIQLHL